MQKNITDGANASGSKRRLPARFEDTLHLQAQALSAGLNTVRLPRRVLMAGRPASIGELAFVGTQSTQTALSGKAFANNRRIVRELLQAAGIPTPRGRMFSSSRFQAAARWAANIGYPVTVRALLSMSDHNQGTIASDDTELASAMEELGGSGREPSFVVVDEFINGRLLNLLVLGGDVASARQLVSAEGHNPVSPPVDITGTIGPTLRELATSALATIPGLGYGSVTVLEPDDPHETTQGRPLVVGVNAAPSVAPHLRAKSNTAEDPFWQILSFHAQRAGFQLQKGLEEREVTVRGHDVADHHQFYAWLRGFGEQSGLSVQTPVNEDVDILDTPPQAVLSGPPLPLAECLVRAVELPGTPGRVSMIETGFA